MKKFFKILTLIFVIVLFVGTIVFLANKTKKEPEVYNIEKPQKTNIVNQTMATGSIVPRKEIPIKPQVSGIVQEIYFEAGSMVKEGQVIAKVKIIPDVQSLNSAESQVKMQKLNLDNETINYNRQKQLFERKVAHYDEILKLHYGDYMTPPPEKDRRATHDYTVYERD